MSYRSQGILGVCLWVVFIVAMIACLYDIACPEHKTVHAMHIHGGLPKRNGGPGRPQSSVQLPAQHFEFRPLPSLRGVSFTSAWSAIEKPVMTKRQAQAILYVFGE